jgi:galactonate dehydratase
MQIATVTSATVGATVRTNWVHVVVTDDTGGSGVGEATLDGHEPQVHAFVADLEQVLRDRVLTSPAQLETELGLEAAPGGLAYAAALSAVEQAVWDLHGKQLGAPVWALLGGLAPPSLALYANLNRALLGDRSPAAFAALAARAVEAGFRMVKCAPFDGIVRGELEDRDVRRLVDEGIARVGAVREAIGPDVDLCVDCHYRFTGRSAPTVLDRLAAFDPYWVEAPVAEHRLEEWARVRAATHLRLAGGEMMAGLATFRRFLDATGVDVVMPDVKYVGGIGGLRTIAGLALSRGVLVAPHCPSGPVSTLASAHACAHLPNFLVLEHAFGEADWRSELVTPREEVVGGELRLGDRPGLGCELDAQVVSAHPWQPVRMPNVRLYG